MADKLEGKPGGGHAREAGTKTTAKREQPKERHHQPAVPDVSGPLAGKFIRVGNRLYRSADARAPIVKLEPDRLATRNIDVLPDLVRIAKANGWTSIRIEGGDRFKQAAYLAAAAQGLEVENYTPTKRLTAEAKRLRERYNRGAPENPGKRDSKPAESATDAEARRQLAQRFLRQTPEENARDPALKAANSIIAQTLAIARARHHDDPQRAAKAVEAKRRHVAARIESGDLIARIESRTRPAPPQSRNREAPDRSR